MLPTKEELAELYLSKSDYELLEIIQQQNGFTQLAREELNKREVKPEQLKEYVKEKAVEEEISNELAQVGLIFGEKARFFFLWLIPFLGSSLRMNHSEDGLTRKVKQSKVFQWIGFSSFMLTGLLAVFFEHSNFESLSIWIIFFIATYLLEKRIVKSRQQLI